MNKETNAKDSIERNIESIQGKPTYNESAANAVNKDPVKIVDKVNETAEP